MRTGVVLRALGLLAMWLVVAVGFGVVVFLNSERDVVVAGHDTVLRPTLDGEVVVRTGPVLPDLRLDSGRRLGVDLTLGKTTAETMSELMERYAVIAGQPEGSIAKVEATVTDLATAAALRGAVAGLVPVAVWLLVGRARRRELWVEVHRHHGVAGVVVAGVVVAGVLAWAPWRGVEPKVVGDQVWVPLGEYLGPSVPLPASVPHVEVRSDPGAIDSRRLVQSAVSTYQQSKAFYDDAAETVELIDDIREPEEGETVAVLVSDRHDNIGMDRVARAIGDRAGASVVLDAGDDTSTGQRWEAFSLDSLDAAFDDYDRFGVTGNHDQGEFVGDYLSDLGWTMLDGDTVDGPGGGDLVGVPDPRSSGLGNWRDETGLTFSEVGDRFSEAICEADDRIETVLVHDVNLARDALDAGCTDLVVGGHVHVKIGPTQIIGESGEVGYSYTNGTTGGAAYAIALGSKPRRDAMVSLVTYDEDGRPAGIQPVTLQTNGTFVVGDYVELDYDLTDRAGPGGPSRSEPRDRQQRRDRQGGEGPPR